MFGQWYLTGLSYKHWQLRAETLVAFGMCLEPSLPDTCLVAFTKRAHFRSHDPITRPWWWSTLGLEIEASFSLPISFSGSLSNAGCLILSRWCNYVSNGKSRGIWGTYLYSALLSKLSTMVISINYAQVSLGIKHQMKEMRFLKFINSSEVHITESLHFRNSRLNFLSLLSLREKTGKAFQRPPVTCK